MAQGHKRASVNATGCRFDSHLRKYSIIFSFSHSGNEAALVITKCLRRRIRLKVENGSVLLGTECLNTGFLLPVLLLARCSEPFWKPLEVRPLEVRRCSNLRFVLIFMFP